MSSTLTEIELAARWSMSPKTLQRWRTTRFGPAYLKLGKKIQYQVSAIESYENQVRTNVANEGTEEIILYLRQTGQATVDQIRSACLGGKKSRNQIQQYLYRLTRSTPPKIQASMVALDVSALSMDAGFAADYLEYFAGLATEIKGETIPMGDGNFNYTIQEPLGVVARIGREECFTELLEFTYTKNVNLKIG